MANARKTPPPVSFTSICAVSRDTIYIACSPDDNEPETSFTLMSQLHNGVWSYEPLNLWVSSMALFQKPGAKSRVVCALSRKGDSST